MAATKAPLTTSRRRLSHTRSRWRWTVERLILLAVAGLMLRAWYVEGLFVPFKVVSGSMAGTLRGVHREIACLDCEHRFACGADLRPTSPRAVCPNCGCAENDLAAQPDIAGDRLLVDKAIFSFRPPRRWELVAFRHPHRAGEIVVKRVVGLPGESIQVRHGEVYVNGKLQRKTLLQQRALAVLVHDANSTPNMTPGLPPRWQDDQVGTGWRASGGRFSHPSVRGTTSIDWLNYRHWRRLPACPFGGAFSCPTDGRVGHFHVPPMGGPDQTQETSITNTRGYNQTRPQRAENVHPVTDVLLSLRLVRTFGHGQLLVRATDGREEFQVRIESDQYTYEVHRNGRPLGSSGQGRLPAWTEELHLEVSLFDRQFLLAFDGHPAVVYPYQPSDPPPRPTSRPLAIGTRGLGIEIRDLRVYRDVYYTHPVGLTARWGLDEPVSLGREEYFVLGDNSLISEDSRTWPGGPAVPARLVVGKPFLVHFPARRIDLGRWHFQVPNPGRIRYIR